MKKIMLIAAAAAGLVAMADGVESGVVGYTTMSLADTTNEGKYYIAGCQFSDTTTAGEDIPVRKLCTLADVTPGTYRTRNTDAPQLQLWTGNGYTTYYYISDANLVAGGSGTAWASGRNEAPDSAKFTIGNAFWLYLPKGTVTGSGSATFAGSVNLELLSKTFDVGNTEYIMMLNPYPVDLTFDMITTQGLTPRTYRNRNTDAPQIQVWTGAGYNTFYYISDATLADSTKGTAWASGRNAATGVVAGVGCGFWVKSATTGTITISCP